MRIKTIDAIRRRLTSSELVPKFAAVDTPVGNANIETFFADGLFISDSF